MNGNETSEGRGEMRQPGARTPLSTLLRRSATVEGVALAIAALCAAGGHGTYHAAKLFFPWSLALTCFTRHLTPPLLVIALLQFPTYAIVLWLASRRSAWLVLAAVHAVAVLTAFFVADSAFSP